MRALMYADWCAVRRTLVRDLVICVLVLVPIAAASNADAAESPAVMTTAMLVAMLAQFVVFGLFGADEQADWEQARLCLPTTARRVVRGRYAFVALALLALTLVGTLAGGMAEFVLSRVASLSVPRGLVVIAPAAAGVAGLVLLCLALEMPLFFSWGLSRARLVATAPFVLVSLISFAPIHDGFDRLDAQLAHLVAAWGSPAPLIVAGTAFVVFVYLASMRLSECLYAARDL